MSMAGKRVVILGATGSIGDTTFRVLDNLGDEFRVVGLSAGDRVEQLVRRARACKPEAVCIADGAQVGAIGREEAKLEAACAAAGDGATAAIAAVAAGQSIVARAAIQGIAPGAAAEHE